MFKIIESNEAINDVTKLAEYIVDQFKTPIPAYNFLDHYDEHIQKLTVFPHGYRGVSIEYRGYEIRI